MVSKLATVVDHLRHGTPHKQSAIHTRYITAQGVPQRLSSRPWMNQPASLPDLAPILKEAPTAASAPPPSILLLLLLPLHLLLNLVPVVALVIQRLPLRIHQQLVGVAYLFESLLRGGFGLLAPARVTVRVPLEGSFLVAGFDLFLGGEFSTSAAQHLRTDRAEREQREIVRQRQTD